MQRSGNRLILSPSDLNHFLECEHLVRLDRHRDAGTPRAPRDAHADLLAEKGAEHERAWLDRFRAEGRTVVDVAAGWAGGPERDWEADAARTQAAMRTGADVVYQGVFVDGDWRGISDFLVRVDGPSLLGPWSYEAWDTKLARQSKPYFVLQLCFYSEQIARIQGVEPEAMAVVLGTGRCDRLRYRDFDAYYRAVRARFLAALADDRPTYPYPVSHCGLCTYQRDCRQRWEDDDHLSQVAHIRRDQVELLHEAGITTVAALAAWSAAVPSVAATLADTRSTAVLAAPGAPSTAATEPDAPFSESAVRPDAPAGAPSGVGGMPRTRRVGIGDATLRRLQEQAALQAEFRRTGRHRVDLLPLDERTGFRLLPQPCEGDVFFDIEGDPYFSADRGLEYLFGVMAIDGGVRRFEAIQALDHEEERRALERCVDFVHERLARWPDLHVYHYAAYEPSALKRLTSLYRTREEALDDLLRRELFVDLYQVVRQAMRISYPSYSIKRVRSFFMPEAGHGAVSTGGDSILEFERWRRTGDAAILQAIVDYNREDCESTVQLRDWLLEQKAEAERRDGRTVAWKAPGSAEVSEKREADDARTRERCEALRAIGRPETALLADLLGYHRREAKPEWWAFFERQKKSLDELLDDTEAIAYLTPAANEPPVADKRSTRVTLEFPDQEFKIGPHSKNQLRDPFRGIDAGAPIEIDGARGRLRLRRGPKLADVPLPSALVKGAPIDDAAQRDALGRLADEVLGGGPRFRAVRDLLAHALPRVRGVEPGASLQTQDLVAQQALVAALDESYLCVQGPPGTGKTYTGARLIVSLLRAGKRVGVSALSHKAINNLLAEVDRVAHAAQVEFSGLKRYSDDEDRFDGRYITGTTDNVACEASGAQLVAGTSWLFSRPGMQERVDYLFIDEAGQLSLADTVAIGTAAHNLVLLGDPQQLPNIQQGVHPGQAGRSALEHLLDGAATVTADRGIFQASTYRMHPRVCDYISELAYDRRLASADGCERQSVASAGLGGAGLRVIPVPHQGNAQASRQEADAIAREVALLLGGGTFTDRHGATRPLTTADILVVAPYNMQVRCLRERLPAGVEVGTVDKFQGREAPVVFFSLASSSGDDVPRGLEFLFSRNRLNVAISRARALSVLVASPALLHARCHTVEQMRLVNGVCRFVEAARETLTASGSRVAPPTSTRRFS